MDDPLPVRGRQRGSDLRAVTQYVVGRQRASLEPRRKRLSFEVFHNQEVDAILVADIEQRTDVRMGQRGYRSRLPVEAPPPLGIGGILRRKDLDRDVAREPGIAGAIDLAHSACTERRGDLVRSQSAAREERHVGRIVSKTRRRGLGMRRVHTIPAPLLPIPPGLPRPSCPRIQGRTVRGVELPMISDCSRRKAAELHVPTFRKTPYRYHIC